MSAAPLVRLTGPAAAVMRANVNTDVIAPPARAGLPDRFGAPDDGAHRLFGPWRYGENGAAVPSFVLNRSPFDRARFLVAGPNFACGSSRETAALWLAAFGIRCVAAPSFGGIFFDNCFRNGILPLALEAAAVERLAAAAEAGTPFELDVAQGTLRADGEPTRFTLPAFRRQLLTEGGDELAVTLAQTGLIDAYQARARAERPWLWPAGKPVVS